MPGPEFDDIEKDDAFDPADAEVDWSGVDVLAAMMDDVMAITDPDARLEAAKALVARLETV